MPLHTDWHIMSDQVSKQIAAYAPLSKDELGSLGVLGDQKLKEYGDRLVRVMQKVVNDHDLYKYTGGAASTPATPKNHKASSSDPRPSKRPKTFSSMKASKKEIVEMLDDDDDDDEFATDIDFDMLDIP